MIKFKNMLVVLTFIFIGSLCFNVMAEEEFSQNEEATYKFLPGEEDGEQDKDTSQLEENNMSVSDGAMSGLLPGEQAEDYDKKTGRFKLEEDDDTGVSSATYQPLPGEQTS